MPKPSNMGFAPAPQENPRVAIEQSKAPGIFPIKKNVKVTNRAEKGALKGKAIVLSHSGNLYPEEAIPGDETTYLQPGETIVVPGDVVLHNFGNVLFHKEKNAFPKDNRDIIANKFGGYVGNPPPQEGASVQFKYSGLRIVAPPQHLPDVILQQIDSRGKDHGEAVSVFDVVTEGVTYLPVNPGTMKLDKDIITK